MKKEISLREFRELNSMRAKDFPSKCEMGTDFYAIALAGEVGELCNFLKKQSRDGVDHYKAIGEEIADIFTYLDLLAESLNIDIELALRYKFNKVSDKIGSNIKL
jgi:NTP pyrophosphatase (non-canonical NTP hydrolase)